ncbi:hypothetical protein [Deinococcus planocerae]|uniref:hypothetical protein n=1 Tax=Deinococcus planocerae TaxID=1737569 RepID=UPI0011AF0149|nr:hypothetical protein [Deinococcus planocerae]
MTRGAQTDPKFDKIALLAHYAARREDVLTYLGIVLLNVDLQEDRAHFLKFIELRWEIERTTPEAVFLGCNLDMGDFGTYRFESSLGLTYTKGVTTLSRVISLTNSELKFFKDVTEQLDEVLKRVRVERPRAVPSVCLTVPFFQGYPPTMETSSFWKTISSGESP